MQLPYALRDPFRDDHFTSEEYKQRWPEAPEYLAALQAGAVNGLLDLSVIQTDKYEEALRQGISKLWAGEDPQAILDEVAAQWDAITERIGVDKQRAAYEAWAAKPNAYPPRHEPSVRASGLPGGARGPPSRRRAALKASPTGGSCWRSRRRWS